MYKNHPILEEAQEKIYPALPKSNKNLSFQAVWDLLYDTRMLKYVHHSQYRLIKPKFKKIAALDTLRKFCSVGYLRECLHPKTKTPREVFITTNEAMPIIKLACKNYDHLPEKESVGEGDINEILNTEAFIQAMKRDDFYTLLYPTDFKESHDLVPDALMVLSPKGERKYRLVFLEIEAKKPNWINTLENKRNNYLSLSKDYRFYDYWKKHCEKIGFSIPEISQLKFSVNFVCSIKENFGDGFTFKKNLC